MQREMIWPQFYGPDCNEKPKQDIKKKREKWETIWLNE